MLLAELKKRQHVVLKEQQTYSYVLYRATKEETDEIYAEVEKKMRDHTYVSKTHDFLDYIDFFGESSDVNHYHIKDIIPTDKVHVIKGETIGRTETIRESRCYQNHKNKNMYNNVIIHEDKLSSFKCACELVKAQSFIILKEPASLKVPELIFGTGGEIDCEETLNEFNNLFKNDGTNNSGDTSTHQEGTVLS